MYVRGDVQLAGKKAVLRALDVPAGQFVELRTVIPRAAFSSTLGMRVASGAGLPAIVAEEAADAAAFEKDSERIENAKQHPWRYALYLLLAGTVPAFLVVGGVFWFYGRELKSGYDREYEQEPPTDTEPALVPTLMRQGGEAGSYEFTATLFDLIRRGVFTSTPVTTERSIWGGLRKESVSDLELAAGKTDAALTPWENAVSLVVTGVIEDGPERLSRFRERIEDDRTAMSKHFTSFKANVGTEVGNRKWFISRGAVPLALALLAFGALGALCVFLAADGWRSVYPRWNDVVLIGLAVAAFVNAAIVLGALTQRKLWRRRSRDGGVEAERWEAFRRYLTDFPRLQEAPPATLALWERLLVYGIAFGIADRVLAGSPPLDARGARPGIVDLLDLERRRPRIGRHVDGHRRPRVGLRLRARASVVRLGWVRRRLLRWWRRGRRRRRRRRLVAAAARRSGSAARRARRARSRRQRRR